MTEIKPTSGWRSIDWHELWKFRELLYFLVWRDVKVRYKQTALGAAWAVIQPALMMVVFTVFLGHMAKVPSANDPVFVYGGILPWTLFATAMANAGSSMISSERLITKVYFPRLAVPWSAVGAAVVDFGVASLLLFGMMMWRGVMPGPTVVLVPFLILLIILLAAGVGTLLAALTVAYRDFRYVIPFLVQFWLFATPPAYTRTSADAPFWLQALLAVNPMSGLIASFRAALFDEPIPWSPLGTSAILVVLVFLAGCFYFRRVEDSFADIV